MLALALRAAEFLFYKGLITVVHRISRLPRDTSELEPEVMRLYRENIALKAQLDANERDRKCLEREIRKLEEPEKPVQKRKRRPSIATRAAQVFAYVAHARERALPALLPIRPARHDLADGQRDFDLAAERIPAGDRPSTRRSSISL